VHRTVTHTQYEARCFDKSDWQEWRFLARMFRGGTRRAPFAVL